MKKRNLISILLYVLILALVFSFLMRVLQPQNDGLSYSQVVSLLENGKVKAFVVQGDTITLQLSEPHAGKTVLVAALSDVERFRQEQWDTIQKLSAAGTLESYDFRNGREASPYDWVIPLTLAGLIVLLVWFLLVSRSNSNSSNPLASFGRARANLGAPGGNKVTFDDVAGADEEKAELQEVVDFLRDPKKYTAIGARIPHGILLVGPPGTGKTLLAKAVAGEADVQFLSISGSDFVEMYVGVGASRVRDLFNQAKKIAPAIIFIDEIDAVGRKRGSGLGGGHDEREQTLNQMLVEMDGFDRTEGVIVLAATNRADILDPALLRPGRFDRQIYVGAPDCKGREEILRVHAKNKRLDDSVDLHTVALATSGFTGADLSNLMNEAAILAARDNRPALNMNDLNEAVMKVVAGPEKRSRVRLQEDLRLTAIHEAGHAVAMYHLPTHDPVRQISIIPRGQALGLTWSLPQSESSHLTRNQMYEQIVGLLGGRVAEALFLGDISTGASNDIDRASKLARDMIARYGMDEALGTISYTTGDEVFIGRDYEKTKSYSEKIAGTIDERVKLLMDKAYTQCEDILKKDADKLHTITDFLLKHEVMSGKQFRECMEGKPIDEEGDTNLLRDYEN
ncbi:MAG: ATP-dependent zinc metalloprotease FtsH [Candidatus Faecousia sp.]|nr:ATP-dependent zinc metalloprotease FtsH [Clostridiales bacterium]MDD6298072.1 ATP-dependent zinc metalloprotease FtsH [Bacillota bacterium]MDY2809647.1 ATP-dependent zinc metalloprotease FtsH [Candidatus Faecousia sp.]